MKLRVAIAIVLHVVVTTMGATLPEPEQVEEDRPLVITSKSIYSNHIPINLEPLKMTTGELKLFAGHSLQFLKAKCPAVSKMSLTQINKYISKLVSKTNPVPERSPVVDKLLTSISSCATRETSAYPEEDQSSQPQPSDTFFHTFLTPFITLKGFFSTDDKEVEASTNSDSTDTDATTSSTDASVSEDNQITETETEMETEDKQDEQEQQGSVSTSTEEPPVESIGKKDDDSESEEAQWEVTTKAFPEEEPKTATGKPSIANNANPSPSLFTPEDDGFFFHPTRWIYDFFHTVRNYFQWLFGSGTGSVIMSVSPDNIVGSDLERVKRDVSVKEEPQKNDATDDDVLLTKQLIEKLAAVNSASFAADGKKDGKGKLAFLQLMDTLCRVYCAECHDVAQILNIKAASKALLQFVYSDETGVELAAKHFIDQAFLDALDEC